MNILLVRCPRPAVGPWSSGAAIQLIDSSDVAGPTAVGYPARLGLNQKVSTLVLRDVQGHAPAGGCFRNPVRVL